MPNWPDWFLAPAGRGNKSLDGGERHGLYRRYPFRVLTGRARFGIRASGRVSGSTSALAFLQGCSGYPCAGGLRGYIPNSQIHRQKRGDLVKKTGVSFFLAGLYLVLFNFSAAVNAQNVTTGTVIGTVTDPSGAAVPDAAVVLRNKATNSQATQNSNSAGQYTFANVAPGEYQDTVKKAAFRTADVATLTVDVEKSYTLDFKMELGQVAEVVQVEAGARVELQTTDATVGNVLASSEIQHFPALTRQVNELLTLQPGATPTGEITGARSDQS